MLTAAEAQAVAAASSAIVANNAQLASIVDSSASDGSSDSGLDGESESGGCSGGGAWAQGQTTAPASDADAAAPPHAPADAI